MLFIITGISGSGKTTVARALVDAGYIALDSQLNPGLFHFVDADGHIPESNHPNDTNWLSRHNWVLNRSIFDATVRQHSLDTPIFLCGGGDSIKLLLPEAKKCFLLEIDAATLTQRLANPTRDNKFGQTEAARDRLLRRLDGFQANQLAAGAITIDAAQSADRVVKDIIAQAGISKND